MLFPVWGNTLSDHFERLALGHLFVFFFCEIGVHWIKSGVEIVVIVDLGRWIIVGLSPKIDLLFAVYLCHFLLV